MTTSKKLFVTLIAAASLSACGGYTNRASQNTINGNSGFPTWNTGGNTGGTGGTFGSPGGGTGTGRFTGVDPYEFPICGIGYTNGVICNTSWGPRLNVRSILRMTFRPEVQDRTIAGTGYSPVYSVLGVYINVGSNESRTPMPLSNGLVTAQQTSPVIDHSNSFTHICSPTNTNCTQPVDIVISHPNNDAQCIMMFGPGSYCMNNFTQVYSTYPWRGTLRVETDQTNALEY